MMDTKQVLLQQAINCLTKNPLRLRGHRPQLREINLLPVVVLKMEVLIIMNYQKNYTNQLLENLRKEKCNHLVLTIFDLILSY